MDFSTGLCCSGYLQVEPCLSPEHPDLNSSFVLQSSLKTSKKQELLLQTAPVREENSGFPRVSPRLFINVPGFSCCVGKLVSQKLISQGICWMEGAGCTGLAPLGCDWVLAPLRDILGWHGLGCRC